MPGVESTGSRTPRSALRYRSSGGNRTEERTTQISRVTRPSVQRASLTRTTADWPVAEKEELNTQARPATKGRKRQARQFTRQQHHPLFLLGIGMLVTLTLWVVGAQIISWGQSTLDTLRYGYPRTFQIDAVVGHQDSARSPSHFLLINLHGRIQVVEWPGGDASHARIYLGPQLLAPGSDQLPAILHFVDITGDHRPDMVIDVEGSRIVFINDAGSFRPLKAGESYTAAT